VGGWGVDGSSKEGKDEAEEEEEEEEGVSRSGGWGEEFPGSRALASFERGMRRVWERETEAWGMEQRASLGGGVHVEIVWPEPFDILDVESLLKRDLLYRLSVPKAHAEADAANAHAEADAAGATGGVQLEFAFNNNVVGFQAPSSQVLRFTCFTSTKVQTLTPEALRKAALFRPSPQMADGDSAGGRRGDVGAVDVGAGRACYPEPHPEGVGRLVLL
jgi:hypothetical protein